MYDVTALGEILIDFTPAGLSPQGNITFERNPGGAPANLLVSLAKLGRNTAFIGKVGDDLFGHYLIDVLKEAGINASGVRLSDRARTTLAFVQLDKGGDRSFSFYRNPGADMGLFPEELNKSLITQSRIFHFGSLSLTDDPSRSATFAALDIAEKAGITVSYDPNLRPLLWKSLDEARERILSAMPHVDILKISEDELELLVDSDNMEKGSKLLSDKYNIPLVFITRGEEGCFYRLKSVTGTQKAFTDLKVVDTTGAGDAFLGGILYGMLSRDIDDPEKLNPNDMSEITRFACAVAGLCTTMKGAIPAMPTLEQVNTLMQGL